MNSFVFDSPFIFFMNRDLCRDATSQKSSEMEKCQRSKSTSILIMCIFFFT